MAKIYQRFDLDFKALESRLGVDVRRDLGSLSEECQEILKKSRFAKATSILTQRLLEKGYEVLESNDVYCGLHGSIILGGELGKMDHKDDFYELAAKFNLPYRSGHSYFPQEARDEQEQLAQSKKQEMHNPVKGLHLSLFPIKDEC